MIGGVIKYFRLDFETVLWKISYTNLNMLLATIPTYEMEPEKDGKTEEVEDLKDFFN